MAPFMRMRRLLGRCGACWLAFLVFPLAPLSTPVGAAPPSFDEHAIGDAGDVHWAATPILPGNVSGTLLVGSDDTDWYRFEAEAGQFVRVHWQVDVPNAFAMARLHGPAIVDASADARPGATTLHTPELYRLAPAGTRAVFTVPHNGTWYIELRLHSVLFEGQVSDLLVGYTFALGIEDDLQTHVAAPTADTTTATVHWDTPGDVAVYLRIEYPRQVTAQDAGQIAFDLHLIQNGRVDHRTVGIAFQGSAPGEPPMPTAIGRVDDIDVTVEDGETLIAYVAIGRTDTMGSITMRSYALRDDAKVLWAVAGQQVTIKHTDQVEAAWSVDRHDPEDVVTVVGASGQRERQLDIPAGFLGAYAPDRPAEAYALAPDGRRLQPGGDGVILFDDEQPGSWRFVDGATTSFGRDTQGPWLHGSTPPVRADG